MEAQDTYVGVPRDKGTVLDRSKEGFCKVVNVEDTLVAPVGIVSKAVYPDILEPSILWKPFFWPE